MPMSIAELEQNRAKLRDAELFAPEVHIDPEELRPLPKGPPINLMEKYRPQYLGEIVGQDQCVKILRAFLKNPYPVAFLFGGESGVGKTSAAVVLANELGCDTTKAELGGVWQIPSGEQSVSAVRELASRLHFVPFYGSGWKVVVINEADYMASQAEAVWLDVLENLPPPNRYRFHHKQRQQTIGPFYRPMLRDSLREQGGQPWVGRASPHSSRLGRGDRKNVWIPVRGPFRCPEWPRFVPAGRARHRPHDRRGIDHTPTIPPTSS